jgi:hypothetical protein
MRALEYDPVLRNVAIYGYHAGARLDPALMGTWEESRIGVITVDEGWIWYIPLARGLVSVGVVTNREALARRRGASLAEVLDGAIAGCDEVRPLLSDARRVRFGGATSDVLSIRDYCYTVTPVRGPGWALCGDASGFVDPILSIGAYLAHSGASRLAYTLNTLLDGSSTDEELCFRAYEEQVQFALSAFRRMTYMFYGFNETKESWWWEAHKILRERALPEAVDRKAAFLALATGYGINRPVFHEATSDFGVNIFDTFYRHLVEGRSIKADEDPDDRKSYRRVATLSAEPWMVPIEGTGKMRTVQRVALTGDGTSGRSRLFLPPAFYRFLSSLDGTSPRDVLSSMPSEEAQEVEERLGAFMRGLRNMGVIAEM